jgi:beta-N-acetylhexosaminidase
MTYGFVMLDIASTYLSAEDKEVLQHPQVGGIILFTRNYESPQQLVELIREIRLLKPQNLLIAADQEGGRVQRFREGFVSLPSPGTIGRHYVAQPEKTRELAKIAATVMCCELLAVGMDFSFAPILDLYFPLSKVIADRAWHADFNIVTELADCYITSMHAAGMAATGKHFPGHGSIVEDSHLETPNDLRDLAEIYAKDLQPFLQLSPKLDAIMPAHIIFPNIDPYPAGFSKFWLQDVLRQRLKFQGVIFSDDLSMEGAGIAGDHIARAEQALMAGCDMVLVCNNRPAALQVLENIKNTGDTLRQQRLANMQARKHYEWHMLHQTQTWHSMVEKLQAG